LLRRRAASTAVACGPRQDPHRLRPSLLLTIADHAQDQVSDVDRLRSN
jgi:hypothetical protein